MPDANKPPCHTPAIDTSAPIELAPPDPDLALRPCPSCGRLLHAHSKQCAYCGFHLARGLGMSAATDTPSATPRIPCRKCNYDLAGNTTGLCPECGTRIARSKRDLLADPNEIARNEFIRPLIAAVIGALLAPLFIVGPNRLEIYVIGLALSLVAGAGIHVISARFVFGTGETARINAAQGAGLTIFFFAIAAWYFPVLGFGGGRLLITALAVILAGGAAMWVFDEDDEQDATLTALPLMFTAIGALQLAVFLVG